MVGGASKEGVNVDKYEQFKQFKLCSKFTQQDLIKFEYSPYMSSGGAAEYETGYRSKRHQQQQNGEKYQVKINGQTGRWLQTFLLFYLLIHSLMFTRYFRLVICVICGRNMGAKNIAITG